MGQLTIVLTQQSHRKFIVSPGKMDRWDQRLLPDFISINRRGARVFRSRRVPHSRLLPSPGLVVVGLQVMYQTWKLHGVNGLCH